MGTRKVCPECNDDRILNQTDHRSTALTRDELFCDPQKVLQLGYDVGPLW